MFQEKIMLLSDYETENSIICEKLRLKGFNHLFPFLSPTEALMAVPGINPDLIIADMNMHGLDGWQLAKIFKFEEFRKFSQKPIILFSTTHKDAKAQQLALESGASAIFHFPSELDKLIDSAHELIKSDSSTIKYAKKEFQKKIIVTDNDPNILNSLKEGLNKKGYQVETADNGEEAIKVIEKMKPHVAILDYQMPVKDGMEALKWIKGNMPEMGVIILADSGSESIAINFLKSGADDYIMRPFEIKQVIEICEESFNKYNIRLINKQFKENAIELKASEEKYRAVSNYSADFIYVLNKEGNFSFVNGETETILGYKPEEMLGRPFSDFILEEDIEKVRLKFFERRTGKRGGDLFEIRLLRKERKNGSSGKDSLSMEARAVGIYSSETDESAIDMMVRSQGLYLEERLGKKTFRGTIGIARDISGRKKMKEQMLQADKLSTIGILVSSVAHELNNPLTGILGYSELIIEDPSQPESIKNDIKKIHNEALRCSKIVRNLLTFSRKYKIKKEWSSINEVVQNTAELVEFQLASANIKLHLDLSREALIVFLDFHQIQQILINIISNAIHAIQDANRKGNIYIQTRVKNNKCACLSIKNDGPQIEKEIIGRVFDHFFTTKTSGKGTGLGLSIASGIIKDHGGSIRTENLTDGVLFTIELPLKSGSPSSITKPQNETEKFVRGKKIMVVEDGKIIRQLLKRFLEKDGHFIESVFSGEEGLKKAKKGPFDLIISDIKLPEMDGLAFYHCLIKIRPKLANRFIFISGAIPLDVIEFSKKTGNRYLQKPFRQMEIRKLIHDILKDSAK